LPSSVYALRVHFSSGSTSDHVMRIGLR
jgi:hypothetical protein